MSAPTTPSAPPPVCFIDTETTGVHPGRRIWEIAIIRRDPATPDDHEWHTFVDVDLRDANPYGLNVGRFYERHPLGQYLAKPNTGQDCPDPHDWNGEINYLVPSAAAADVARLTHGAHLVGAVPNFDTESLAELLRAHGLTPAWHYHLIDVETLAVGWLRGSGPTAAEAAAGLPWSSDELSRLCGVEPPSDDERHTALGDARWARRIYDQIIGRRAHA